MEKIDIVEFEKKVSADRISYPFLIEEHCSKLIILLIYKLNNLQKNKYYIKLVCENRNKFIFVFFYDTFTT